MRIGHGLGLNVVAEGVETRADWEAVARAEVDEVQAQSSDSVIPWIEDWNSRQIPLKAEQPSRDLRKFSAKKLFSKDQWHFVRPNALGFTLLFILMPLSAVAAKLI